MSFNESEAARQDNTSSPAPRLRVNKTTSLTLTTSYQVIDLAGTSSYNINSFPVGPDGSNKMVYWDSVNKKLVFQGNVDKNYDVSFNLRTTATNLLSALNVATATVKMQFYIPAPTPIMFPFPDDADPSVDIMPVNLIASRKGSYGSIVYANSSIRQYGLQIRIALSNGVLGAVTMDSCDVIIYGR